MDQAVVLKPVDRQWAVEDLIRFVAAAVTGAPSDETPFYHLRFERVFPDDVYAAMLSAMPVEGDYRPMSGRARGSDRADGTHTRVKIDLLPEYIRSLPPEKAAVWDLVGAALRSSEVKDAIMRRLAPGLSARFGADFMKVGMYPLPILTRDITGYRIIPHPDTIWKGITVQFYLPRDSSITHVGTIFHERISKNNYKTIKQMKFAPNSGYAFAVDRHTWHSADTLGPEVTTRDSILLTYFVDSGVLRKLRNRTKRLGNFVRESYRGLRG